MKKIFCLILLLFVATTAQQYCFAAEPLPQAQAFQLETKVIDPNTLLVHWSIAPGYFLYHERVRFKLMNDKHASLGKIILPIGTNKIDKTVGTFKVFRGDLNIPVPILGNKAGQTKLIAYYQGCADSGFCYPPSHKSLTVTIDNTLALTAVSIDKETDGASPITNDANHILATKSLWLILLSFFGFGLLLSFTPCVLPMIPVLSGIIVGHGKNITTKKAFALSLVYVLSMSLTYAAAGVLVALLGSNLQAALQNPWVISSFSALFVLLALAMFGFYDLRMPEAFEARIANISKRQQSGAYLSAAIMGCLATLILSPCVTAPLVGVLTYIAQTGNAVLGASALFTLSLGMGVPLLLIGTSAGKLLPQTGMWMNAVKKFFGVMLLAVAIYLLSRIIPGQVTMALWAALFMVCAVFMGALRRGSKNYWQTLWQGLGIIMLTYGVVLMVGVGLGNSDPLQPLAGLTINGKRVVSTTNTIKNVHPVKSLNDVQAAIQQAAKNGRPVMLDFYADWCISCKIMEKTTFADPTVQQVLRDFVILKADVTANDATDKALEKYYSVIAPPTFVFFDQQGNEVRNARIVGEVNAKQFLQQVRKITQ